MDPRFVALFRVSMDGGRWALFSADSGSSVRGCGHLSVCQSDVMGDGIGSAECSLLSVGEFREL